MMILLFKDILKNLFIIFLINLIKCIEMNMIRLYKYTLIHYKKTLVLWLPIQNKINKVIVNNMLKFKVKV